GGRSRGGTRTASSGATVSIGVGSASEDRSSSPSSWAGSAEGAVGTRLSEESGISRLATLPLFFARSSTSLALSSRRASSQAKLVLKNASQISTALFGRFLFCFQLRTVFSLRPSRSANSLTDHGRPILAAGLIAGREPNSSRCQQKSSPNV